MDALPFLTEINLNLLLKIPVLVLVFLYVIFSLILFNKVRSLGRMVFISHINITILLDIVAFIHFALSVSLFFISLVIL